MVKLESDVQDDQASSGPRFYLKNWDLSKSEHHNTFVEVHHGTKQISASLRQSNGVSILHCIFTTVSHIVFVCKHDMMLLLLCKWYWDVPSYSRTRK